MEEPLVPPGNPLRPRSLAYSAAGCVALVLLMASDAHWALSVPLGALAAVLAACGALDFAGCFDDAAEPETPLYSLAALSPRLLELSAQLSIWALVLRAAVAGGLPQHAWSAPLLVTLSSLGCVVSVGRLLERLSPPGAPRLHQRAGFWLMVAGIGLYVPWLGSYSLLDPWEPHYGEVAREMLARDDWLSLWWAQDGWFWSKPVLNFWLQGLFFSLSGVAFQPDQMLAGVADGRLPQPEWAARMPVALLALGATYALYRFVSAAAGRRAGLLSALVLLTLPYWSLLSHQSMTDMPYVAPLTAALSLFGLGLLCDPERRAPALRVEVFGRRLQLSAFHGLFVVVLATALPPLAYLVSRNVTLQLAAPPYGFRWHLDELFSGSGLGNCGLPGNEACRGAQPANAMFQPALGAAVFGAALGLLLRINRGERRAKRLLYLAAWYFTALAALAKGAPGLVLPLAVAGAVLVARRDWHELARSELAGLGLMLSAVCLPWYVQMYMRHGEPFTDRLLFHDMYKRAFVHVHDTNAGTDTSIGYYIWQLGYAAFPWTGLALAGVAFALGQSGAIDRRLRDLALLTVLWLTLSFGMFALSLTKFHHYALPCAPPLACCTGLLLDRALQGYRLPAGRRGFAYLLAFGGAASLLVWGVMRFSPGATFGGVLEGGQLPSASAWQGLAGVGLGAGLLLLAVLRLGERQAASKQDHGLAVLGLAAALLTLLVARDLSTSLPGDVPGSARLFHLITYNYKRAWPPQLNFEAVQWAFGVVAAACAALSAFARLRAHLVVLACAVGVWFCAFTLWIYLPRLAPHFGQRELFLAYYAVREGPHEPIVAYQMNWKGENFYSGNRLPAFVSSGAKFKNWLKKRRKAGARAMYFVTEHGRVGTLKAELGAMGSATPLTDKTLNDKFALVRVELAQSADTKNF